MKILILGVNGFIGSSLSEHILANNPDWQIYGMDISQHKLQNCLKSPRFHFVEGDITINKEWLEYHVKKCDVVLPLVAIANPAVYVTRPLSVFELDFEANLPIVRWCVKYRKRLIFPSTSEIYGMCDEPEFDEETSRLIVGPVSKQRWIYSICKQLMDRVIYAYGFEENLNYTLFRPFNWLGAKMDDVNETKEGSSRAVIQFISNVLSGSEIKLVDGGRQRRSFTYIDDALKALIKIIENKDNCAYQRIFNIGNPSNDFSIREVAQKVINTIKRFPNYRERAEQVKIIDVSAGEYFGQHYQDMSYRLPSIKKAKELLDWEPNTNLDEALYLTLVPHLSARD